MASLQAMHEVKVWAEASCSKLPGALDMKRFTCSSSPSSCLLHGELAAACYSLYFYFMHRHKWTSCRRISGGHAEGEERDMHLLQDDVQSPEDPRHAAHACSQIFDLPLRQPP